MEFNFNWKYNDYEIRRTTNPSSGAEYWELVKWQHVRGKDSCFTLAYFVKSSEDWELKFCGTRPFDYIEIEDLRVVWNALSLTNNTLNTLMKIHRNID